MGFTFRGGVHLEMAMSCTEVKMDATSEGEAHLRPQLI
jgi:hypothetical protein